MKFSIVMQELNHLNESSIFYASTVTFSPEFPYLTGDTVQFPLAERTFESQVNRMCLTFTLFIPFPPLTASTVDFPYYDGI